MSKKKRPSIPRFETPIFETHCHLDYLDTEQLDDTLARCADVGVRRIVTIAVSPDNLATVRGIAEANPGTVWTTQGIHPHEAEKCDADVVAEITEHLDHPRVLAVGEIGLDYYYDHADRQVQRNVFETQLQLAVDADMPVVIHTREADDDTRAILQNFSSHLQRKGVIHSFTSGMPLAQWCLAEGFALGFNGIATFRQADNVREVVRETPLEQLLLETDAPYLTPVPYRGRPNAPFYLPFIAELVAREKDVEVEALLQQAWHNSMALFFPTEAAAF